MNNCGCDNAARLLELPQGTLLREFVWGDPDRFPEPVVMISHDGAGNCVPSQPGGECVFYYLHDALGSVVGLTDSTGALVERYTYDPYGKTLIERLTANGCELTASSAFGSPWAWTGQRYDAGTGLYSFLFRAYSPSLGRWLQRDPEEYVDGVNLYAALLDNPINSLDPLGLDVCQDAQKAADELKKLHDRFDQVNRELRIARDNLRISVGNVRWLQSQLAQVYGHSGKADKAIQYGSGCTTVLVLICFPEPTGATKVIGVLSGLVCFGQTVRMECNDAEADRKAEDETGTDAMVADLRQRLRYAREQEERWRRELDKLGDERSKMTRDKFYEAYRKARLLARECEREKQEQKPKQCVK